MKNLILLRHASPATQGTDGTDFTRPLLPKGEDEARLQGGFLREAGIVPEVMASSTALRAATTAQLLAESMGNAPMITCDESLYNAAGDALLDYLKRLPDHVSTALIVAHMPGVAELVAILAADPADMAVNFQPCTMAGISLERAERWSDVKPNTGVLEWLLPPIFGH